MMMMWMQQQVFNYRDVVSFAVVSISYHTYRYLAGEMRKKKNDTLAGLPFTWLVIFHHGETIRYSVCSSSKDIEKRFFFVRVVRWDSLFAHFFFCFFSTEKVEIRQTNKQTKKKVQAEKMNSICR
jgi:hypothetical protein